MRYRDHPDPRIRARFAWEGREIRSASSALLWAMERRLRKSNEAVAAQIRALRAEIAKEAGILSRSTVALLGPVLLWAARREEKRLARGVTYEPPTFIERRNWGEAAG